ncbi:MAG: hypothetical protein HFJ04_07415 [Lachnospiraceae bacterium]|nr:hypothetical protein [Lachnospiraceae bacterium]
MTGLLEIREKLKNIYGKYDIYLKPLFKFILSMCVFLLINGNIGYMERISKLPVTLVFSLICSILPVNFLILLSGVVILLHLYALSLEVAVVALILFLLMALLYFRFAPKDGIYAVLTPICLHFNLGPVMPVTVGLLGKAYSVVSVVCGTLIWFFLNGIKENAAALGGSAKGASELSKFTTALNQLIGNKEMYLVILSFMLVTVMVLFIRRLSIDYAWTAAIVIGALVNFIVLFAGYLLLGISGRLMGLVIGSLVSLGLALILEFLFFNLDYTRTERVQFEDDEYYYYVKAIPKMYVAKKEKQVKTFSSKGGSRAVRRQFSDEMDDD